MSGVKSGYANELLASEVFKFQLDDRFDMLASDPLKVWMCAEEDSRAIRLWGRRLAVKTAQVCSGFDKMYSLALEMCEDMAQAVSGHAAKFLGKQGIEHVTLTRRTNRFKLTTSGCRSVLFSPVIGVEARTVLYAKMLSAGWENLVGVAGITENPLVTKNLQDLGLYVVPLISYAEAESLKDSIMHLKYA